MNSNYISLLVQKLAKSTLKTFKLKKILNLTPSTTFSPNSIFPRDITIFFLISFISSVKTTRCLTKKNAKIK